MKPDKRISYSAPESSDDLPESPELERAVLGALILEPEYLSDAVEIVDKNTFLVANNGILFEELTAMLSENAKIDLYTLSQRPNLKGKGMVRYLSELTNAVGSGANVLEHARLLQDLANRRRLMMIGYELAARSNAGAHSTDEIAEWMASQLEQIVTSATRSDDLTPLAQAVRDTLDDLERRQQAREAGECIGIPTGIDRLDALTGGWRGGQLIVLAGRPAMGKSAVMLHFARTAAASGVPVCIYSLEMPTKQLIGRMLLGDSGVDAAAFRTGNVDSDGWVRLERAGSDLSAMSVYLNDRANISINTIRSQCKAMQRRGKCGMVLIDYLQLLDTASRNRTDTREREIAAASRSAKLLAKEIGVPVILLSQLSRKVEERADKTPLLSDLRESGAIEQDADLVAFIDRPAMYGRQTIEAGRYGTISSDGVGVLHIAKNRDGATGSICFRHNESLTRISDYHVPNKTELEAGPF